MLLYSQVFIEGIMLRAYSNHRSDALELRLAEHRNIPISWVDHAGKHRNCGSLPSSIVPEESEYLIVIHADGEILDCDLLPAIELLPQGHDLDTFLRLFQCLQRRVDLLVSRGVPRSTHFLLFAPLLLLRSILRNLLREKAKERMLLGSPLVGYNLVEVPCQNQVEENVEDKADEGIPNHIVVKLSAKRRSDLVGISIYQSVEGDDERSVRNYAKS